MTNQQNKCPSCGFAWMGALKMDTLFEGNDVEVFVKLDAGHFLPYTVPKTKITISQPETDYRQMMRDGTET